MTPLLGYPWYCQQWLCLQETATGYDVKDTGVNNAGAKANVGYISR